MMMNGKVKNDRNPAGASLGFAGNGRKYSMRVTAWMLALAMVVTSFSATGTTAYAKEEQGAQEVTGSEWLQPVTIVEEEEEPEVISLDALFQEENAPDKSMASADSATAAAFHSALAVAMNRYDTIIEFSTTGDTAVKREYVEDLLNDFVLQNPEFFYLDSVGIVTSGGILKRMVLYYTDSVELIKIKRGEYAMALAEAVRQVDVNTMSKAQICAVIHDYLILNCDYVEDTKYGHDAYGALVEGRAVCQGYALAYQDILNALGISSVLVASDEMNHAWNMVEINGSYYHVDVTWDEKGTDPGQANHQYLLLSKNAIEKDHYGYEVADDIKNGTATTYDLYFWKNTTSPIYYEDGALYYVYPENPEGAARDPEASVPVKFIFVKKILSGENAGNVDLMEYVFANISVQDTGVADEDAGTEDGETEEDAGTEDETAGATEEELDARFAEIYKRMNACTRLIKAGDGWYFTSANDIYKVTLEAAASAMASAPAEIAYRVSENTDVIYNMTQSLTDPVIDGLYVAGSMLYYKLENTELILVPLYMVTIPAAEELYLYQTGQTINLSLNETYRISAMLFPKEADQTLIYESSAPQYVSVADGLVTANAYTHDTPVTITVKNEDGTLQAALFVSVAFVPVTDILISNTSLSRVPGDTKQLTMAVVPSNATNQKITFASLDETVATVDETGLITMVGPGTTSIVATLVDKKNGETLNTFRKECKVVVNLMPEQLTLSSDKLTLKEKETALLTVTILPENATNQTVVYTSSDESVATVSEEGVVTAVSVGNAVITATAKAASDVKDTCEVTVTKAEDTTEDEGNDEEEYVEVTGVQVNKLEISMALNATKPIKATVYPVNATNRKVYWTSSNRAVATISPNATNSKEAATITAVGMGTCEITATTAEGAYVASCKVTVGQKSIKNAKVSEISAKTYTGKKIKPTPKVKVDGKKLVKGVDYTLTYKNNKKVGKATIIIKGIGNYKGKKKVTFTIRPNVPMISIGAIEKKSITLFYSKIEEADGYEIVYARDKKFKKNKQTIRIKNNAITAYTIDKLKPKTAYYIKMRSYTLVKGKKIYSQYNVLGKVKTK